MIRPGPVPETVNAASDLSWPWVLIAGGFHERGAMDRANAALADGLIRRRSPVHLVGHAFDRRFYEQPGVTLHHVARPLGSFALGDWSLGAAGRRVARNVLRHDPRTRVVVNGGNCRWPDVNWVHSVHSAWPSVIDDAPLTFRVKETIAKAWARRREWRSVRAARLVVANSERTRDDVIRCLGVARDHVVTVYLGSDATWGEPSPSEREAARQWLNISASRPVVAFVGALGHDMNKGFDTLLRAWERLCRNTGWDAHLVAAGGGRAVRMLSKKVRDAGLSARVTFLGHTDRVRDVLAAADLLVSPVRYEAYGLNVHEALCRGLPVLVSRNAGIAERFPPELADMLLPEPEDHVQLASRIEAWRLDRYAWRLRIQPFVETLREETWATMAERFLEVVEGASEPHVPLR